jgi:hypothetical protein
VNSSVPCVEVDKDYYNTNLSKVIESSDFKPLAIIDDEHSQYYRLPFLSLQQVDIENNSVNKKLIF